MVRFLLALYLLLPLITIPETLAQQIPGPIRVRVTEVPVDVIVLDRHGHPVLDLKKENFTVFEDRIPQAIVHFSRESYRPDQAGESDLPVPAEPEHAASGTTSHRTFLIVMGRGRHRYFQTIPELIQFVEKGLRSSDRVGFMAYNRATDFVTNRQQLIEVIERYQAIAPSIESNLDLRSGGLAAVYGEGSPLRRYQKEIDHIFSSEAIGSRTAGSADTPGRREQAVENRELLETATRLQMQKDADAVFEPGPISVGIGERIKAEALLDGMELDEYLSLRTDGTMDEERLMAAIEYMRNVEGEKHIIFLHEQGLVLANLEHDEGLASRASDARVRIHAVQTGGVYLGAEKSTFSGAYSGSGFNSSKPFRPFPGATGNAFALQSMSGIARLTGGQSFGHRHIQQCLAKVEEVTAASYLLTYAPPVQTLDGGFRRIEVKVNRPGLRVMHRRGYYAERELRPFDRKLLMRFSRTAIAAGHSELIHDVQLEIQARRLAEAGRNRFRSTVTIKPTADLYSVQEDRHVGQLAISFFLFDSKGTLQLETWENLNMALLPETFERVLKEGFHLQRDVELPPDLKECWLRIVVYDPANDRLGSAQVPLRRGR
jgi:VWFA-related protein